MRKVIIVAAMAAISILAIPAQAQLAEEVGSINNAGEPRGGMPTVCADPAIIAVDDGAAENGYSGNAAAVSEVTIVQRFDSADFPAGVIDAVCIGWISQGPDSLNFEIVVFDDDGPGGAPGTELGAVPASATGLPNGLPETVFDYDVSASGITLPASGNFYLGARWVPTSPNVFIAADETDVTNAGAGHALFDTGDPGDDWEALSSVFPNYSALIVRALAGAGEPAPPALPVSMMSNWALILMSLMLAAIALVVVRMRS